MFVVGMGRSGSSALTRILGLCGAALPRDVLPPNAGNPTGYWEPAAIVSANDQFLSRQGTSWFDPALPPPLTPQAAASDPFVREAAALLRSSFEPGGPLAVKEPRISGLLPYWIAAAAECKLRPVAVQIVRHPDDVAASLAERDGLTGAQSNALWLKYNLTAERDTRGLPRVVISYEELLASWEPVVRRCAECLYLPLAVGGRTRAAVAEFLDPGLRHHASAGPVPGPPDGLLARVYALLGPPGGARHGRVRPAPRRVRRRRAAAGRRAGLGHAELRQRRGRRASRIRSNGSGAVPHSAERFRGGTATAGPNHP